MAGQYSGIQARLKAICEYEIFVPCATHSLNLILVYAAQCNAEAESFFSAHSEYLEIFFPLRLIVGIQ